MQLTNVTVVIVTYKTAQLTIDGLHSIFAERKLGGLKIQTVVVDNASGDSPEIQAFVEKNNWQDWVFVLTAPKNGGFAYGNNFAFKYALEKGPVDYFHLLNPDAQLHQGALSELVNFLKLNPEVGIAGSSFTNQDGSLWPIAFRFPTILSELESSIQFGLMTKLLKKWVVAVTMNQDKPSPVDWIAGASMMLSRNLVEKIRGFNEHYFLYYEETDLCLRAKKAGFETWYVPSSHVMHIAGQSTKVTERNAKPKRLPSYLYESRRHYFINNHGIFYTLLTDLAVVFTSTLGELKRLLTNKHHLSTPFSLVDTISHSALLPRNWDSPYFSSQLPESDLF